MATLEIHGMPDEMLEDLRWLAREHGTSVSEQVVRLLEQGLDGESRRVGELIDEIRAERSHLRPGAPSWAEIIREDRER